MNMCFTSLRLPCVIASLVSFAQTAFCQIQIVSNSLQRIFSGEQRINYLIQNSSDAPANPALHARLYQTSSSIAAPLNDISLQDLHLLPGQTVLQAANFAFPEIRAETPFLIQWLDGTNKVIGTTSVLVYPPDLLKELKAIAGDDPIGLLDPNDQIKPVLRALHLEIEDLENSGLDHFEGKLAIIGPFDSKSQMGENISARIRSLAEKKTGVVWLRPQAESGARLKPSFYLVRAGRGAVVVAQHELLGNIARHPESQLYLLEMARLAVKPEPWQLP